MKKTSPRSIPQTYQLAMLGAQAFPVRTLPCAASEKDWTEEEADSFMRLLDCSGDALPSIDPDGLSLPPQRIFDSLGTPVKMLKVCIAHALGSTLPSFYLSWPLSGTTANGRVSIPRILEYHSPVNACTLSDILEDSVLEKYFLSTAQTRRILERSSQDTRAAGSTTQPDSLSPSPPRAEGWEGKQDYTQLDLTGWME